MKDEKREGEGSDDVNSDDEDEEELLKMKMF